MKPDPTPKAVLFDPRTWPQAPSPRTAPETSRQAAASIQQATSQLARRVYHYLLEHGPQTCAQAEQDLQMTHQTCSARFNELMRKGLIQDTGQRRPTPSGRKAAVWQAIKP